MKAILAPHLMEKKRGWPKPRAKGMAGTGWRSEPLALCDLLLCVVPRQLDQQAEKSRNCRDWAEPRKHGL
jgi:hypothetical protein